MVKANIENKDGAILNEKRLLNETRHGEFLSKHGVGGPWNRNTPAGKERWTRRVELLTRHITPSMRVLEAGCGIGYLTRELAKTRAAITAIDISPDLIKMADSCIDASNVVFRIENAYSTAFPDDEFDAIVGSAVLHHLDVDKALSEFHRILKKGGTIFFTEPNMLNPQILIQKNVPFIKKMLGDSPDETAFFRWAIKRKLKKNGFTEICVIPFDFLHPHIPRRLLSFVRPLCNLAEKIPILSEIAGSLYIVARK